MEETAKKEETLLKVLLLLKFPYLRRMEQNLYSLFRNKHTQMPIVGAGLYSSIKQKYFCFQNCCKVPCFGFH